MEVINEKITEKITEEEKRVKLRQCASLLAPSSTADWVSCNEEMAEARPKETESWRQQKPGCLQMRSTSILFGFFLKMKKRMEAMKRRRLE